MTDEDYDFDDRELQDSGGFERVESTLAEILSTLKDRTNPGNWLWVIFVVYLATSWSGSSVDQWTDKAWYSFRYNAAYKNITVIDRPHDCDFLRAPLGIKGCDYKKRTEVFGEAQRKENIKNATSEEEVKKFAKDANSVFVYWDKVED